MLWARMVSYVTGTVNQELLLRNEYLGAENRILRGQIKGRLLLSEGEKATLAFGRRSRTAMRVTLQARVREIQNGFNGKPVDPGTYEIRYTTLRAILADIGGQIAANKFKWIFVIHAHGAPMHSIAISEACDFISDTFSMTMLNISSLLWADAEHSKEFDKVTVKYYSSADLQAQGMDIHAGTRETSEMLAIDPQRVRPVYKALPDRVAKNVDELGAVAEKPGWEGYFGRPAKASSAYGMELMELAIEESADFILRALRGENFSKHSRYPEGSIPGPYTEPPDEQAFTTKLDQWLRQRK